MKTLLWIITLIRISWIALQTGWYAVEYMHSCYILMRLSQLFALSGWNLLIVEQNIFHFTYHIENSIAVTYILWQGQQAKAAI